MNDNKKIISNKDLNKLRMQTQNEHIHIMNSNYSEKEE